MQNPATPPERDALAGSDDALSELAPVSHAIFRVARLHKTLAGQLLRGAGLYPNQELVMMRLWTQGPQRQVDLVRMLESEAPTMTRTIQRLQKAGLVSTSRSPADGRSIIVEATAASEALRQDVERVWTTLESLTVADWPESRRQSVLDALAATEENLLHADSGEETAG